MKPAGIRIKICFHKLVKTFGVSGIEMQMPSIPSLKYALGTQECGNLRRNTLTPIQNPEGEEHSANILLLSEDGWEGKKGNLFENWVKNYYYIIYYYYYSIINYLRP